MSKTRSLASVLILTLACSGVALGVAIGNPSAAHWALIPITVAGVLAGYDALRWSDPGVDPLDPTAMIGILGLHFFFVAPILHLTWDRYLTSAFAPWDWRPWLGAMALLNILGLVVFHSAKALLSTRPQVTAGAPWTLRPGFFQVGFLILAGTALLQLMIYRQYGGIAGYVLSYKETKGSFAGMGPVFVIAESFPVVAMVMLTVWLRREGWRPSWATIGVILLAFVIAKLFFGGLRGSRSNTLWATFWAVGMIHYFVRRVPKSLLLMGVLVGAGFAWVYDFYKGATLDQVAALQAGESIEALEAPEGRGLQKLLLTDFARADIQAFVLSRQGEAETPPLALGRTYLGALFLFVPRSIWPGRPETKMKEGTQIQYGMSSYGRIRTSRIFGLSGEAMLNFGVSGIPVAFLVFGAAVWGVQWFRDGLSAGDPRLLLVPMLVNLAFGWLMYDFDNMVVLCFKHGVPVLFLLFFTRPERPAR